MTDFIKDSDESALDNGLEQVQKVIQKDEKDNSYVKDAESNNNYSIRATPVSNDPTAPPRVRIKL
jgi:hypothetical protein